MQLDGFEGFHLIGSGGNAHVYRALETATGKLVAVKLLRGGGDDSVRRRFERERVMMAELATMANVVPVYQSGIDANGDPYLVMPLFSGGSLQDLVDAGPTPWQDAVRLIKVLASSMALAHAKRILHLDLKPANVLLDESGQPFLADFGISELMGNTASMSAAMMTPAFTPPERFSGEKPGELTDIYGLIATLYALITGVAPYITEKTTSPLALMKAVADEPLPVELLPANVPTPVRNLLLRGMAKDPAARPQSAIVLVGLIDDLLLGRDIDPPAQLVADTADPVVPAFDDAPVGSGAVVSSVETLRRPGELVLADPLPTVEPEPDTDYRRPMMLVAGVAVLAAVGLGAFFVFGRGGGEGEKAEQIETATEIEVEEAIDARATDNVGEVDDGEDGDGGDGDGDLIEVEVAGTVLEQSTELAERSGSRPTEAEDSRQRVTVAPTNTNVVSQPLTPTTAGITPTTAAQGTTPTTAGITPTTAAGTTPTTAAGVTPTTADREVEEPATPALEAGFVAEGGPVGAEQTVAFRSITVGDAFGFEWDFGDDSGSQGENVSHTYASPGTYQVTITASADGVSDSATHSVRVDANSPLLEAGFRASAPIDGSEQTIWFENISTGEIESFLWDFGDGTSSNQQVPQHTYERPGTYSVTITATSPSGQTNSATHSVRVEANATPLEAGWTASASASPDQQTVSFTSITIGQATQFSWDFGDGSTGSGATISHTYAQPGTYSVRLVATTDVGVSDIATHSVTVDPNS